MKNTIKNNGEIETLTQPELEAALTKTATALVQEQARGFSTVRFASDGTIATGALTVPAPGNPPIGPEQGFAWAVQRVVADNLATADVLKVYRNAVGANSFLGVITATNNGLHCGSHGLILRGGEQLLITGASLTATGDIVVTGEAIEVGELDIYKIL